MADARLIEVCLADAEPARMRAPEALGLMIGLCIAGNAYGRWTIDDIGRLLMPPVLAGQFAIWVDHGRCAGFATWAFVSDPVLGELLGMARSPRPNEWQGGPHLFIVDFVSPFGDTRQRVRGLQRRVLGAWRGGAWALRRDAAGRPRRGARWPSCAASRIVDEA